MLPANDQGYKRIFVLKHTKQSRPIGFNNPLQRRKDNARPWNKCTEAGGSLKLARQNLF